MPVDTQHSEYTNNKTIWQKVRDACDGQEAVKSAGEDYLPQLNGQDDKAYDAYRLRAQYINFTGRTLDISLGQLFRKPPTGLDEIDAEIIDNINLSGQSFFYFSRNIASEVFKTNRAGVLVDWSDDLSRPYLTMYRAEEVINWRVSNINGNNALSLVVLHGKKEKPLADIFRIELVDVWRVLLIEEGKYIVRDYSKDTEGFKIDAEFVPLMNGAPLDFIPFYFVSTFGNSVEIHKPPLLDFANVNLGHYKNSADFENLLHWTGAKTVVTVGYGKNVVPIGGAFDLPEGGNAFFLEASSDSGLKEEMKHKEEQMAAMGTAIISGKGRYVASAETSKITSEGEYATLADIANSMSDSMSIIMSTLDMWAGGSGEIQVEYNTDYEAAKVDPTVLMQFMAAVQGGAMSWETFFYNMQTMELYPDGWTIEEERASIESSMPIEEEPQLTGINVGDNTDENVQEEEN